MGNKKDVFVIMPFSSTATCTASQWTEVYEDVFRPAIEMCGYSCERALPMTGRLTRTIIERLRHSRIVLADITDRNPNVFYELGIRHSLSKRTIVVVQGDQHTPSDLMGYWYVAYGTTPSQVTAFKKEIKRLITDIENNPDKSDNPVSDYLEEENLSISSYVQKESVKKLGALYTECSGNLLHLKSALTGNTNAHKYISDACLVLLLQTLYIDIGANLLKFAYELQYKLRTIQLGYLNMGLIEITIDDLNSISLEILKIRNRLAAGEYDEPTSVSTMEWKPEISDERLFGLGPLLQLDLGTSCLAVDLQGENQISLLTSKSARALNIIGSFMCEGKEAHWSGNFQQPSLPANQDEKESRLAIENQQSPKMIQSHHKSRNLRKEKRFKGKKT